MQVSGGSQRSTGWQKEGGAQDAGAGEQLGSTWDWVGGRRADTEDEIYTRLGKLLLVLVASCSKQC